jgi:hypothetical protein
MVGPIGAVIANQRSFVPFGDVFLTGTSNAGQ